MPSSSDGPIRLCVFGDSHYAAVRQACNESMVDLTGFDVEFWGHTGGRFRNLKWQNDRIEPADEYTARRFAKFNENNRTCLESKDFDVLFFVGCRLTTSFHFAQLLHELRQPDQFMSSQLRLEVVRHHLFREPTYLFARQYAALGHARVIFAPTSFDTAGMETAYHAEFSGAYTVTAEERNAIWDLWAQNMALDDICLLPQPDDTVTEGCLTLPEYASDNHIERNDNTHKNAAYGAKILQRAIELASGFQYPAIPAALM